MANSITRKQYEAIKNIHDFSVVSFEGNRRVSTYGGLNIVKAIDEILSQQRNGRTTLLIRNLNGGEVSRDFDDYKKYLDSHSFLFKEV